MYLDAGCRAGAKHLGYDPLWPRAPGDETAVPARMATQSPCPAAAGSRPSASRFGRLRAWGPAGYFARPGGACDTSTAVLKESPG
jgi:hypothetical protein